MPRPPEYPPPHVGESAYLHHFAGSNLLFAVPGGEFPRTQPLKRGKHFGTGFERMVALQAARSGMLLVEHGVKVRYAGARVIPLKSDLDFRLMHQGRCVFFDAKTRQGETLPLSSLSPAQRKLVTLYDSHGFAAGFLAEFRASNQVVFFSGADVARVGPRGSLRACDGKILGQSTNFALGLLLA